MSGDFNDEPFPEFSPHDIKTSTMTGDMHCRLCGVFYPLDESCEAPKATFTSANGTEWVVVYAKGDSGPTLRFYDRAAACKPGFNGVLGQFVSEYYTDTIINGGDSGLNLMGGVDAWRIDRDNMFEVSQWALRIQHNRYVEDMEDSE